ncbi:ATP-dependent DNA ligase [Rhizobium sp. SLBN-94]|nr:ATP-dependent DNA ligase [Rhizobium sp. SLBN-94]
MIAEIEYRGFMHDGKLRHASYKRLREVQDNAAVFKIEYCGRRVILGDDLSLT